MDKGKVDLDMSVAVDVEEFASSLAWHNSEDQAKFFEEFFIQLELACEEKPSAVNTKLQRIVANMGLQSMDILERMAEFAKAKAEAR